MALRSGTRSKLKRAGTATLATALFKRGFRQQVAVPAHLADKRAAEAAEMTAYEDFMTERVRDGQGILGLCPATGKGNREAFARWRKEHGR